MKSAVLVGLLCIVGLSGCAHNRRAALALRHPAVMDSLPQVVKSLPIQIVPSFEHPVLAWSTVSMMGTYVCYNPRIADRLPPDVLAFALVHEYGHLWLNHVRVFRFGENSSAAIKQQELDADCFAARFWATNDTKVVQAAVASFLSATADGELGSEKPSLEAGYPTRRERAQVILDCLAEVQRMSAADWDQCRIGIQASIVPTEYSTGPFW